MSSRSFSVFQDVPSSEAVKTKPANPTIMATRSSARLNQSSQDPSTSTGAIPIDKENVHPVTGERAAGAGTSKKRKTNALAIKQTTPLTAKKVKPLKDEASDAKPEPKRRKTTSAATKNKTRATSKKDGSSANAPRKTTTKRLTRKVSQLPRLEEEAEVKGPEAERITQATIDSRCYELTVQPLADVTQAYDVIESTQDASPASKVKFCKDTSTEPEIRDFFSPSQTLTSSSSASTILATPTDPKGSRRFSTPERKQIYAAFTFSTPSPTGERFSKSLRSGSVPRLELA